MLDWIVDCGFFVNGFLASIVTFYNGVFSFASMIWFYADLQGLTQAPPHTNRLARYLLDSTA
jgi:hypothetical protein